MHAANLGYWTLRTWECRDRHGRPPTPSAIIETETTLSSTADTPIASFDLDAEFAAHVARSAADTLLSVRARMGLDDARALRDAGDAEAQAVIAALLSAHRPDDAVLSEEAKDSPARLAAERVWIIDPLDGTREFAEGRDDWAVHVALWEAGTLTVGAVALGGPQTVLTTADVAPRPDETTSPLRIAVSRTRPPAVVEYLQSRFDVQLVPMGSAGVKISAVVTGEVDAYVHGGGQFEWDSAAPVAVARAAGLHTSRLDGSELVYNRENPYLPDLVVCPPSVAERLLTAIGEYVTSDTEEAAK